MSAASAARPSYPSASTLTTVWFHILGCDGLGNPGHQAARAFARKSAPHHRDFRAGKEEST